MKLKLFLLLIITQLFSVNAQTKWTLGAVFRPEIGYRSLFGKDNIGRSDLIIGLRDDTETPRWCYTAGVSAQYQLKPRLNIESGILISDKGFQTKNIPVTTLENPDPVINFSTMRFVYHHYYLDIPITAHYQIKLNETYQLQIGAGICNSFNTDVYQTSYFTNESGVTTRQKSTDKDRFVYQKYLLSSVLSARIERPINEKISISLEVRGQFSHSNTFLNSYIREHFWTSGIGIGAWWRL